MTKTRQKNIYRFMDDVYSLFKHHYSPEPITIDDLRTLYEELDIPYVTIDKWIDIDGDTPLHYAVRFWECSSIPSLIDARDIGNKKINVLQKNNKGKTAMRVALEEGNVGAAFHLADAYPYSFMKKIKESVKPLVSRTINNK